MVTPTQTTDLSEVVRLPAPLDRRVHWRRAYRALRTVIADPERTDQVIELINSIGGNADLHALVPLAAALETSIDLEHDLVVFDIDPGHLHQVPGARGRGVHRRGRWPCC